MPAPFTKKVTVHIYHPGFDPNYDYYENDLDEPEAGKEPVQEFLARVIEQTQHLQEAVVEWGEMYYHDSLRVSGYVPMTTEEIERERTKKERAKIAAEKRKLAKAKKEEAEAIKVIKKAEELKKKYPGIASSIG